MSHETSHETFSHLGLIGDVHEQASALQTALDFLRANEVEQIVCTGDIVDGFHEAISSDGARCIELLQYYKVLTVRGNHDRWLLSRLLKNPQTHNAPAFLHGLPTTRALQTVAGRLLLCHGMGENDMQGIKPDDDFHALQWKPELHKLIANREYSFAIAGHTHARMTRRFERIEGEFTVINAGALHPDFEPCVAIADFEMRRVQFYDLTNGEVESAQQFDL